MTVPGRSCEMQVIANLLNSVEKLTASGAEIELSAGIDVDGMFVVAGRFREVP